MSDDTISRQAAIDAMEGVDWYHIDSDGQLTHGANSEEHEPLYKAEDVYKVLNDMPSAQPERLTDDDFETIRIHLNAHKEKLCNQHRWEEADEYQRIIDRFMAFASAQPDLDEVYAHAETEAEARFHAERKKGKWIKHIDDLFPAESTIECSECHHEQPLTIDSNFCPNCGARMEGE